MVSVMMAPENSVEKLSATIVINGIRALRNPCTMSTRSQESPFALAVRM